MKLIERSPFTLRDRVECALVYLCEKPASTIILAGPTSPNISQCASISSNRIKVGERLPKKVKLHSETIHIGPSLTSMKKTDEGYVASYRDVVFIHYAKDASVLESLVQGQRLGDDTLIGKAYGFPDTAIQGFLGIREPLVKPFVLGTPVDYFTFWVQSQEYFKEEIASTSVRWHNAIQQKSPKMYREIKQWIKQWRIMMDAMDDEDRLLYWRYKNEDGHTVYCYP